MGKKNENPWNNTLRGNTEKVMIVLPAQKLLK